MRRRSYASYGNRSSFRANFAARQAASATGFSRIASVSVKPSNVETPATTAAIDTTGAKLIVAAVGKAPTSSATTFSDSKGNTWTALTERSNTGAKIQLYYCINPTVGTGHTFTGAGTTFFGAVAVAAYSLHTNPVFDEENGGATNAVASFQPGSVTADVNGSLFITAVSEGGGMTYSIDTGFTIIESKPTAGNYGVHLAEKIQTTAAAENPTWTPSGATAMAAAIAVFDY